MTAGEGDKTEENWENVLTSRRQDTEQDVQRFQQKSLLQGETTLIQ